MRMLEFADKYGLQYCIVYQAMAEEGKLRKWRKNAAYGEEEIREAVETMLNRRITRREREIFQLKKERNKLNVHNMTL